MLTGVWDTYPAGLGEPMNIIISARSDPEVLTLSGIKLYLNSLNFSQNCLGKLTIYRVGHPVNLSNSMTKIRNGNVCLLTPFLCLL